MGTYIVEVMIKQTGMVIPMISRRTFPTTAPFWRSSTDRSQKRYGVTMCVVIHTVVVYKTFAPNCFPYHESKVAPEQSW